MKAQITQLLKTHIVEDIKTYLFPTRANTYIAFGRPIRWGSDNSETAAEIEDVVDSIDYNNQVHRDMVAMKKIEAADTAVVVPRRDWITGVVYDQYNDHVALFSFEDRLSLGTVNVAGNLVTQNSAVFTGNVAAGNTITIGDFSTGTETREIIGIAANVITLNTATTGNSGVYWNVGCVRVSNTYPQFANNFYVRNSKDQVFKCLYNANSAASTIEPTIDIDGQLPENPYILTGDDYKWKYLYTIPYGLKQKFFTNKWMPVITDAAVVAGSENGRIDTVNITDGGTGYFLDNSEDGNTASLFIITVVGDGEGANISATIVSGVITDLNILDGGSDYTTATITVDDPDQLANGTNASFEVVISPHGGHGSDPSAELGCYSVMTSVDFVGTETDTLPVGTNAYPFDFRQISLLRDPVLANGAYANASVYRTTTKLTLTSPGVTDYLNDESVYIGSSLALANMSATVIEWSPNNNELFINNIAGNVVIGSTLTGDTSSAGATILEVEEPDIETFTADTLYIENRAKIIRDVDQTEQIRLVLSF
jgi:hypothetical protein